MQFGIGILGANYDPEAALANLLVDEREPHRNFAAHAHKYAGKLAAETILYEPPSRPDLSDRALVITFAACARPVHISEARMVRAAFTHLYDKASA